MVNDMVSGLQGASRGGGGGGGLSHPSCLMPSATSNPHSLIIKEEPGLGGGVGGFGDVSSHASAAASLHSQLSSHVHHHHHHPSVMRSTNVSSAAHSWMQGTMLEQTSK